MLPPVDLQPIRAVLTKPGVELARSSNADGHVVIQICWNTQLAALLLHDGSVRTLCSVAA